VRRAMQVLGLALITAGLFLGNAPRDRDRRTGPSLRSKGGTSDRNLRSRLPLLLFWVGAVLLVLSSI
jgi:hypothetical protein